MGNLLKDAGNYVKQTVWDQPTGVIKDVAKGDFKGGFDDFKGWFGDNERAESDLFHDVGIRGWVGDHPGETAAAVVATIFGGWAAAGAYGGAAGTAGTAAGAGAAGSAGTTAGVGATGVGAAGTGAASLGTGGTATGIGAGSVSATPFSAGSSVLSYAPAASSASVPASSIGSTTAAFSAPAGYTGSSAASLGSTPFANGSSVLGYTPTQSSVLSSDVPASSSNSVDFQRIQQAVNQMNSNKNQEQQPQSNFQLQQFQPKQGAMTQAMAMNDPATVRARQNQLNSIANNPFLRNQFITGAS